MYGPHRKKEKKVNRNHSRGSSDVGFSKQQQQQKNPIKLSILNLTTKTNHYLNN